ncbi:sigma-70 family RNA polymerase sigma factor [Methanolobus zinderi]|uniref:Sigma-70 family RNA polymerase sigma factor n=1 Tax=Methanolobus zinderi TaxID=536044 RepID=A0A7D5E5Z8_9EURY|nr:FeoC-like transcriptional regulator [Methanolobus zinderi]QLC49493.1 sigma-70 family RNA polymerase sigma factor [Methanolobus zinderi]
MIKDLLKYLYVEKLSMAETAQKLGISSERLKEILQSMEHMGYIKIVEGDNSPGCSACGSCSSTSVCHTDGVQTTGKKLVLTEKGQRLCEKI